MKTPLLIQFLLRIAGDPRQRFRIFLCGLVLFIIALVGLYSGQYWTSSSAVHIGLTRFSTCVLITSLLLCASSYLAMLLHRFLLFWLND